MSHMLLTHSVLRWIALALILATIIRSAMAISSNSQYGALDNKLSLFSLISVHLQLLLGFGLYFMSPLIEAALANGMGEAMKDSVSRFWVVEHLTGMIIGITLITIGRIKAKKGKDDKSKFKTTLVFFVLGLLVILASIPWPFREVLGKGWI